MTVRVGKYLVKSRSVATNGMGQTSWVGSWTIFRSPLGNGRDWEILMAGRTPQVFSTSAAACFAGEDLGTAQARKLQSDDWLEPIKWPDPLPEALG